MSNAQSNIRPISWWLVANTDKLEQVGRLAAVLRQQLGSRNGLMDHTRFENG